MYADIYSVKTGKKRGDVGSRKVEKGEGKGTETGRRREGEGQGEEQEVEEEIQPEGG